MRIFWKEEYRNYRKPYLDIIINHGAIPP